MNGILLLLPVFLPLVLGLLSYFLPIRSAISNNLFPDMESTFTDAIAHLRTNTDSDYDSGK